MFKEYILTDFGTFGFGRAVEGDEYEFHLSKEWVLSEGIHTNIVMIFQRPKGWKLGGDGAEVHQGVKQTKSTKGRKRAISEEYNIIAEIDTEPGSSHGRWTTRYSDGRVVEEYRSENENGERFGVIVQPSGDTYEGYWKQGYLHLFGKEIDVNDRQYLGEIKYDLREGNGRYKRPNGVVYRGKFLKGNKHGKGEYVLLNGCTITVETEVGYITKHLSTRRHTRVSRVTQQEDGKYRLDYEDGAYYIGQINEKTQQREGYGLYVHKHKDYWYQGQWQKDIEHGTG